MSTDAPRLLVVGNFGPEHVGRHFAEAARALGIDYTALATTAAYEGPPWARRLFWQFGHRPLRIGRFGGGVVATAREVRATALLTTGIAPLGASVLQQLGEMGITRINFLTDDPWNPVHRAPWFMAGLNHYDHIFTPRRANIEDLKTHGCKRVSYLPFAFSPVEHFPEARSAYSATTPVDDVFFAGGADPDRVPVMTALIRSGLRVALYGGYWDRFEATRPAARGMLDMAGIRHATGAARVSLCLVRRANRDGHAMRSFEAPAMRGCLLVEATPDHREMFGPEGEAALYFRTPEEAAAQAHRLLSDAPLRDALAARAHARVTSGANTYADRLRSILAVSAPA